MRRRGWAVAVTGLLIAGFTAYDFRDSLPPRSELCAMLPKLSLPSRYRTFDPYGLHCPWDIRVRSLTSYEGLVVFGQHGALFIPRRTTADGSAGDRRWWLGQRWMLKADDVAWRSLEQRNSAAFQLPDDPPLYVTVTGWRVSSTLGFGVSGAVYPAALMVDKFADVKLFSQTRPD